MEKTFGMLVIAGMVWIGIEIYSEGMHGAFGGALASITGAEAPAEGEHVMTHNRAGEALERAHQERADRFDKLDQH